MKTDNALSLSLSHFWVCYCSRFLSASLSLTFTFFFLALLMLPKFSLNIYRENGFVFLMVQVTSCVIHREGS